METHIVTFNDLKNAMNMCILIASIINKDGYKKMTYNPYACLYEITHNGNRKGFSHPNDAIEAYNDIDIQEDK